MHELFMATSRVRAPVLRVFVPCTELDEAAISDCEDALMRAGLWEHLSDGDVVCKFGYVPPSPAPSPQSSDEGLGSSTGSGSGSGSSAGMGGGGAEEGEGGQRCWPWVAYPRPRELLHGRRQRA